MREYTTDHTPCFQGLSHHASLNTHQETRFGLRRYVAPTISIECECAIIHLYVGANKITRRKVSEVCFVSPKLQTGAQEFRDVMCLGKIMT